MAESLLPVLLPSSVSQQRVSMPTGKIQSWNRLVLLMSENGLYCNAHFNGFRRHIEIT